MGSPSNNTVRIGPIEGIWRSSFIALCFRPSANGSRRTCSPNERKASSCWDHFSVAYSDLASLRMGMSGSPSFHSERKS